MYGKHCTDNEINWRDDLKAQALCVFLGMFVGSVIWYGLIVFTN